MDDKISPEYQRKFELEYSEMVRDENRLHNTLLHQHILETWERSSPQMWARLEAAHLTKQMAYGCQQTMWERAAELRKSGLPVTDAREQAEREHLMLEPEEPETSSSIPWAELAEAMQEGRRMVAEAKACRESQNR